MIKTMIALGIMQFKEYNIYKSNYILWTINRLVEITAYIFIWIAIYNQTGDAGGLSLNQMVIYYILVVTLVPLVTWGVNERDGALYQKWNNKQRAAKSNFIFSILVWGKSW